MEKVSEGLHLELVNSVCKMFEAGDQGLCSRWRGNPKSCVRDVHRLGQLMVFPF
jgi:hypothetical protein